MVNIKKNIKERLNKFVTIKKHKIKIDNTYVGFIPIKCGIDNNDLSSAK